MTQLVNLRYDSNHNDKPVNIMSTNARGKLDITVTGSMSTNFTFKFNKNTLSPQNHSIQFIILFNIAL